MENNNIYIFFFYLYLMNKRNPFHWASYRGGFTILKILIRKLNIELSSEDMVLLYFF